KASAIPYTIVRATQFFEFVGAIVQSATEGDTVRVPPAMMQPILADDVATAMVDVALATPLNRMIDLAGPERIQMDDLARTFLKAHKDARQVVTDPKARYYGTDVNDGRLAPVGESRKGPTRYEDWVSQSLA